MRDREACRLYRRAGRASLAFVVLFAMVALLVASGATYGADGAAERLGAATRGVPGVAQAAGYVSLIGTSTFLIGSALVAALLAYVAGYRLDTILPFAALGTEWVSDAVIKGAFARQRPTAEPWPSGFFGTDQYSFPSGHAMASAALFSLLACWAWASWPGRSRLAVTAVLILVPVAVGLSRVVLGVHWLSDVAGGWMAGCAATSLVVLALRRATKG